MKLIGHQTRVRCLAFLCGIFWAAALWAGNDLKNHPSPYLALHGEDPVGWRDWNASALRDARARNRPLFISSGYFACHWCHVMQRESFQDKEVAKLLNEHFIPVKLDRELNPALDDHLIRFVEQTRGQAGWPLNVILTPEGYPLVGITYQPRDAVLDLLNQVAARWREQDQALSILARSAAEEIYARAPPERLQTLPEAEEVARKLTERALRVADEMGGGFGGQSRFPMSPQLGALLAAQRVRPDERLAGFLRLTLDQMSTRAMRDHLGGGFFRYTVDPGWTTPHFEKMLYSQAELVRLYLAAARGLGVPAYRAVARDTLDFVLRDMAGPQGGYIASLSAVDARGNEGGAYLWTPEELATLLSEEDLALATAYWSLEPALSPDLGLLPQRLTAASEVASALAVPEPVLAMRVADLRGRLLSARAARPAPRDTKELAGWNGLMLSALVAGAREFGDSRYADAAAGLAAYLRTLWDGKQLYRAREGVRFLGQSGLSDYAYVAAGLADWAEFRGSSEDLQLARELFGLAWKNYFSDDGWILASNALVPGMRREAAFQDGPLASPAAVLVSLAQRQQLHQQQVAGLGRARAMAAPMVLEMPFWHATHARNLIDSKKPAGDLKKPVAGRPAAAHRQGTKS